MAKTILSVDDSASVRQMVNLTLSGAGYQVVAGKAAERAGDPPPTHFRDGARVRTACRT